MHWRNSISCNIIKNVRLWSCFVITLAPWAVGHQMWLLLLQCPRCQGNCKTASDCDISLSCFELILAPWAVGLQIWLFLLAGTAKVSTKHQHLWYFILWLHHIKWDCYYLMYWCQGAKVSTSSPVIMMGSHNVLLALASWEEWEQMGLFLFFCSNPKVLRQA